MPSTSACNAASLESRSGAKPPSSPTAVARPWSWSVRLRAWKTSAPMRRHSENERAPAGTTMNSWTSTLLSAWAPPLSTLIIGTGSTRAASPPRAPRRGRRRPSAATAPPRPSGCRANRGPGARGRSRSGSFVSDPLSEPVGRGAEGELGIDPQHPGAVDEREELIADSSERCLIRLGIARRRPAARRRGAALELARVQRRGQVVGHVAENPRFAPLLAGLDAVPVAQDGARGRGLGVAEHVRVAADELLAAVLGHRGQGAGAALLEQQREEVDLEQHVAELVEELAVVTAVDGVGELVGLLHGVGDDRTLVLLAVPRAVVPQAAGQLVEAADGRGDVVPAHPPVDVGGAAVCGAAPPCGAAPAPPCGAAPAPPCGAAPAPPCGVGVAPPCGAAPAPFCGVGVAPGAVVLVFFGLGAFEQSWVMKPLRQFVRSFHFFWKSLTKSLSAFCEFCDASSCLMVLLAWASPCCEAAVTFVTSKT